MAPKEEIENLVRPIIEREGYKVVSVKLKFQGRRLVLEITIDKEGGASVEDCTRVSRLIEPILDKEDLMKQKYFLIVSSPGI